MWYSDSDSDSDSIFNIKQLYKVNRYSYCELKRDILYFVDCCNDIISS